MEVFLKPRSVALVGVPREERPGAYVTLLNLLESFDGDVYPVNPHASEILGVKAYRSIKDVPADVDLAVISTKRELVPQMVEECVEKGVHGVIIVTQGFAEADAEGRALQEEIVRTAKAGGVRVLGPNTMGVLNAFNGFSTTFGSLHGVPLQERWMPAWMQVRNPVDIWVGAMAHGPSKVYEDVIRAVLCDEDVAALLCIYFAPMTEEHAKIDVSDVIKEVAAEFEKPVVVWLYGYPSAEYVRKLERGRNVAVFPTIRRAVQALAFLNAVSSRLGSH